MTNSVTIATIMTIMTIMTITITLTLTPIVQVQAHRLTATSYQDGYSKGMVDASRDAQGLNGHGYDSSCPSGHTDVYCSGYDNGYNNQWNSNDGSGSSTATSVDTATSQRTTQGQSSGNINVRGEGNTIEVHQDQASSSSTDSQTRSGPTYLNQPNFGN